MRAVCNALKDDNGHSHPCLAKGADARALTPPPFEEPAADRERPHAHELHRDSQRPKDDTAIDLCDIDIKLPESGIVRISELASIVGP